MNQSIKKTGVMLKIRTALLCQKVTHNQRNVSPGKQARTDLWNHKGSSSQDKEQIRPRQDTDTELMSPAEEKGRTKAGPNSQQLSVWSLNGDERTDLKNWDQRNRLCVRSVDRSAVSESQGRAVADQISTSRRDANDANQMTKIFSCRKWI